MEPVEQIIGYIIIEGGKYLLKKIVDAAGKAIWRAFTDEDGDQLPDDPENPFREWDEDPGGWDPLDPFPVDPGVSVPVEPEQTDLQIIIVSPDGTMTIYDREGNITAEDVDTAYSLWISDNGALDKPFNNYTVSEALLLFIAIGSVVALISKLFKRRKL